MSSGGSKPSHVIVQYSLLGGADVLELFPSGRRNRLTCTTVGRAVTAAAELAHYEHAILEDPLARERSRCPRCGHEGPVLTDFGIRQHTGNLRPQSWCRVCRHASSSAVGAGR